MRNLLGDLRFALRLMARDRVFTLGAVLTLMICVGANAAIFAVVRSVLYRPLPYPEPRQLVLLYDSFPGAGVERAGTSIPNYLDRLPLKTVFESQALYRSRGLDVGTTGSAERVRAMEVTPSFLHVLRTSPVRGRDFAESEGTPGQHRKAIVDFGYAQATFGNPDTAVGRDLRINGEAYQVVGVMPRSFTFVDPDVRIWVPLAFSDEERSEDRRYSQNHDEIARLAPGATIGQATPRVDALNAASVERAGQLKAMLVATGYHTRIVPFADDLVADVRRPLQLLWGGVLFVLLIAAVNITNLVLVRASGRSKELATRHALGAARGRVAQQLLTETTLLTAVGALLGVGFGAALLRYLSAGGLAELPRGSEIRMDGVVVAFTVGVATLLGLATAAVPIVHLAGIDILHALREEGRSGTAGRGARLFRRSMVVVQVALAFVLLIGAGLLLDSFRQLMAVDPGFRAANVLTAKINPPAVRYPDDNASRSLGARALEGIRRLPGVQAAGITTLLPFAGNNSSSVIVAEGYVPAPGESVISPNQIEASPGYFEAMGIPLKRGRLFTDADGPGAPGVIIVDERLARKFWPNADPIGRRMLKPDRPEDLAHPGPNAKWLRVVGVVQTVKLQGLGETTEERVGAYYTPFAQEPSTFITFAVKTTGEPGQAVAAIRRVIADVDPAMPLYDVRTMPERLERSLNPRRTPMLLSLAFGAAALLLAAIGIYGVLAYQVGLRSREIGIRMALGGDPASILRLVLREGLALVAVGLVAGGAGVFALKPVIASQLFGVGPLDPVVIGSVAALLVTVAGAAAFAPARRAARIDPISALGSQ
jgi:predicted permease